MAIVLVVDALPDARYSIACPLAEAGFDVRETATGRDALRLARAHPDAIVLDSLLRDIDGFEMLRRLKTDPVTRDIPVILKMGVHGDDAHRERALHAGAAACFADRFDPPALVATIRAVLTNETTRRTTAERRPPNLATSA